MHILIALLIIAAIGYAVYRLRDTFVDANNANEPAAPHPAHDENPGDLR